MSATPVIEIADLWFAYDRVAVLADVNLTVSERDFVCIVGPNGGGKTTLLKLVLGLLRPTRGTVRVFGLAPGRARRRVGYVPQHPQFDPQFPVLVRDVVLMGRLGSAGRWGRYGAAEKAAAQAALERVELGGFARRSFAALSGGQRQRVLIARALACEPELLLMDEPTASLDLYIEGAFSALLRELNRRLTVVVVSHDVGFVSDFVKHVVCVNRRLVTHPAGRISGQDIREIYGHDVHIVRHDQRRGE